MLQSSDFHNIPVEVRLVDGRILGAADLAITKIYNATGDKLRVTIKNTSAEPVEVAEIALIPGQAPIPKETKYYGEGYHMLCQYRGDMENTEIIGNFGSDKKFFSFPDSPHDKGLNIVYGLLTLTFGEGGHTLFAFASCHKFLGKFRFGTNYVEAVMDAEGLVLQPGQAWDMEELVVFSGEKSAPLYDQLAAAINANHPPMAYHEEGKIPTGWCSYYCVGQFDPEAIYQNARDMAERIPELEMIQIDAGMTRPNGDWQNWQWPDDMAAACEKVRAAGVTPGGYYSPFIVEDTSDVAKNHPEWLVHGEDGKPTNALSYKKSWYILDGSHPGARENLRKLIRYYYDECQFRYFKLDFLSYGALPAGKRYDQTKTSVEAYRMGMKAMLEEVGPDSFVLACNAPFWPTLGLAHGNRSTNDIFRAWKQVRGNALEQFYRNWQHQKLWINDPDVVVLERLDITRTGKDGAPSLRPCTLTDPEFEFHKAFAVASGGMILSGDLIGQLSDENIKVLKKMKTFMGEAATFDSDAFEIGRFKTKNLICVFNWDDEGKVVFVPILEKSEVQDFWTNKKMGTHEDEMEIYLPAHGARILHFLPERAKRAF